MKRLPYEIVINALHKGTSVTFKNNLTVYMDENNMICHKMQKSSDNGKTWDNEYYLLDLEFNSIVKWSNEFTEDELFIIGCNGVLQEGVYTNNVK